MSEPRKATDVLLDVESKVGMLLDIIRAQDLNIKVLSNKLNDVIGRLDKQQISAPKIMVEAIQMPSSQPTIIPPGFTQIPAGDPERNIPVTAESKLPQAENTQGFRRNSRPETYAGDNSYLPQPELDVRMPVQIPKMPPGRQGANVPPPGRSPDSSVVVPAGTDVPSNRRGNVLAPPNPAGTALSQQSQDFHPMTDPQPMPLSAQGQIPVQQRCVDKNGKSIFLADVEITDLSSNQPTIKTRTNGTGKWAASLGIGAYRVVISKRAAMNKEKLEAIQDIQVDGSQSPLELPMMIIK
jgi:hypothetical protein